MNNIQTFILLKLTRIISVCNSGILKFSPPINGKISMVNRWSRPILNRFLNNGIFSKKTAPSSLRWKNILYFVQNFYAISCRNFYISCWLGAYNLINFFNNFNLAIHGYSHRSVCLIHSSNIGKPKTNFIGKWFQLTRDWNI